MATSRIIAVIDDQIKELRNELAHVPAFRQLTVLEETRRQLIEIGENSMVSIIKDVVENGTGKVTIIGGAELALEAAGQPLTSRVLLDELPKFGAVVGGADKLANLVSILSKRGDRVRSVRWLGKPAWWIKDRPLPNALTTATFRGGALTSMVEETS